MIFHLMQVAGTIFFAISGALSACKKNFDLTGAMLIAFAVGDGGGTLRDVLIGSTPVFWMQQPSSVVLTMLTGLIVFFIAEHVDFTGKAFLIIDALGLGVFAIVGAQKTLALGLSPIVAVMMGVLTAVGGGVIRDILSGEIPLILRPEVYATAALAGATVFVTLHTYFPESRYVAGIACALTVFLIRLGTIQWGWCLPTPGWLKRK